MAQGSKLGSVNCGSALAISPGSASCTVDLTGSAPTGGLSIHLSAGDTRVTVPTSVVVPAGSTRASFTANVSSGVRGTVTLGGTFNGFSETYQLQISAATAVAVSVTPISSTINTAATRQFVATVTGTANEAVTWTVSGTGCSGTACGTITAAGLYTAPSAVPSPRNVIVKAISAQDPTESASANVLIAATYYIAPASGGGSDRNDGLTASTPWLTPNHSLDCGDLILAAAGDYDAQYFNVGSWGSVSCPKSNNVAWLKCAKFDSCHISTSTLSAGIWIDRSFWGVQGWEVTTQKNGGLEPSCFVVSPNWNNPVEVHHVILADNIANGCQGGGISITNHPGLMIGVDYLAIIGNIAYNATQGSSECFAGISIYAPIQSDSVPGTHIYLAGNFAWNNWNPDTCAGGPATDGEGIILDEIDASNQSLPTPYAAQIVADNNILIANGGPGLQIDHNNVGSGPWATIYSRHNTMWGNNHDLTVAGYGHGEWLIGEVNNTHSTFDLGVTNIAKGGSGSPVYAFFVIDSPTGTDSVSQSWGYSASGTNADALVSPGFSFGSSNTFGTAPDLKDRVIPPAPSCSAYATVAGCMATVINDFTPDNTAAKDFGYQVPGTTAVSDPLFPKWLCGVTHIPGRLVTMGCLK